MATLPVPEHDRILRAALTLKLAFLYFREATWHSFYNGIASKGKTITLLKDSTKANRYNGWFSPFPNHLVHDPHEKNAVLTTMSCYEIGHMKKLTEQLFEGMDVLIEEVRLRLKPIARRTVIVYEDAKVDFNDYDYWTIRITSRSTGKQTAVDICGPQYDIQLCGFDWDYLCRTYVEKILSVQPFGSLADYTAAMIDLKGLGGFEFEMGAGAMKVFHETVDPAMEKKGLTWATILGKNEKDYARHSYKVLKVGKKAIEAYVAGENLTKRRQKAERYEKRHEEELDVERVRLGQRLGYE
ncbi:Nn.00g101380.m01.CDS01 [Neocucurbitaria sp. VM-36]